MIHQVAKETPASSSASRSSTKKAKKSKHSKDDIMQDVAVPQLELTSVLHHEIDTTHSAPLPSAGTEIVVHRLRCVNYLPSAITCMKSSLDRHYLAMSRSNGSVELRAAGQKYRTLAFIPGSASKTVEVMTWISLPAEKTTNQGANALTSTHPAGPDIKNQVLIGGSSDGTLFVIDFHLARFRCVTPSGGGAIMAMTHLQSDSAVPLVAAGGEDGSVRIYRVTKESSSYQIEHVSTIPAMVGASVLSLAWCLPVDQPLLEQGIGSVLYAGGADGTIRRFDCSLRGGDKSTGPMNTIWKSTLRMTVESLGRNTATRVWALLALRRDHMVISGDSLGHVQMWDGRSGTLLQSFHHNPHKADVLALCSNEDESHLYASGVDSLLVCFTRSPASSSKRPEWIMNDAHRPHSHDVNAIAIVLEPSKSNTMLQEVVCTGGVDTKLCTYHVQANTATNERQRHRPRSLFPWPDISPVSIAGKGRVVAMKRDDRVDFYSFSPKSSYRPEIENQIAKSGEAANGGHAVPVHVPKDHRQFFLGSVKIKSIANLTSCALSDDGRILAVGSAEGLVLFAVAYEGGNVNQPASRIVPSLLPTHWESFGTIVALHFVDPRHLLVATSDSTIRRISFEVSDATSFAVSASLEESLRPRAARMSGEQDSADVAKAFPVRTIAPSDDGNWVATVQHDFGNGSIHLYHRNSALESFHYISTLPIFEKSAVTTTRFLSGSDGHYLVVACCDFSVYLFDVVTQRLCDWSEQAGYPVTVPREFSQRGDYPTHLASDPGSPSRVLAVSFTFLVVRAIVQVQGLFRHNDCFPYCVPFVTLATSKQ
jgi:WD40 repeat protein